MTGNEAPEVIPAGGGGRRAHPAWLPVAHPILLGSSSFLLLLVSSGASLFAGIRMVVVAAAVMVVITVLSGIGMRDRHRGGVLALTIALLLIVGDRPLQLAAIGVGIALLIVERVASLRRPTRTPWPLITRVLNAVAAVILIAITVKAVQDGTVGAFAADIGAEGPAFLRTERPAEQFDPASPDIYVLMLDGYVRDDKLRDLFGYDNGPFLAELAARGFDVSSGSRSNYLLTAVSLSSAFNMRHLTGETSLAALPVGDVHHVREARSLINHNEVFREVRARGYETIAMASGFEEVSLRTADRYIDTGQVNEVELLSMRSTTVAAIVSAVAPQVFADQQRARIDSLFGEVEQVAAEAHQRPRFVFAHIPSPHAPVVFRADGSPVEAVDLSTFYDDRATRKGLTSEQYGELYTGQVAYLNGRVLRTIDAVLASAARPPVIVLFSDHGSANGFRPEDLVNSDIDERSANLVAALTPGREKVLGDSISLVNLFGVLFDSYFGTHHVRQPDTVYRWTGASIFNVVPVPGIEPGDRRP